MGADTAPQRSGRGSSSGHVRYSIAGKEWIKTRSGRSVLAALAWTIIGCLFALPDLSAGIEWRRALLVPLAQWWSWGILTPLTVWVDRRLPFSSKQLAQRIAAHLLLSLLVTSAYIYVVAAVRAAMGIGAWSALL